MNVGGAIHQGAEGVTRARNRKAGVLGVLVAVLCLSLLVPAACTRPEPTPDRTPPPASPSPTGPARYGGPAAPRLDWTDLWQVDRSGLRTLSAVRKVGSRLVVWGTTAKKESTFLIIDAATGKRLWDHGDLPAELSTRLGPIGHGSEGNPDGGWADTILAMAVDDGRGGVLILEYDQNPCLNDRPMCHSSQKHRAAGAGLIAVSLVDRSVRWATEVTPAVKRLGGSNQFVRMKPVGASDSVIAAVTYSSGRPNQDLGLATVAIDPRTGKRLWRAKQVLPSRVEGDRVLALKEPTGDDLDTAVGTPVVLDGRTGDRLFSLALKESASWRNVGDGLATMFTSGGSEPSIPVVDLSDGRVVLDLPTSDAWRLMVSESSSGPVAWWYDNLGLFTQSVEDPTPLFAPWPSDHIFGEFQFAHGDHIWMETRQGQVAYDRSGTARSELVPGTTALQVDDDLILVARPDDGLRLLRLS
jgi:outer membrane protein assembly factor BamB